MTTTSLETLKINVLSKEQYQEQAESLDQNALYLTPDDGSTLVTQDQFSTLSTKVDGCATKQEVSSTYATKQELKEIDLSGYVKTETLSNYATTASLNNYATKASLNEYVTDDSLSTTLGDYVQTSALTTALTPYAKTADLTNYVTVNGTQTVSGQKTFSKALTASAGLSVTGAITATGNITGAKVYNAVWNDYAEWFEKADLDETFEPGDVCVWTGTGVTKSNSAEDWNVVGVVSDTYGHIIGGEELEDMEDNNKKFVPIALVGRVRVKVIGRVYMGDTIVSYSDGVGYADNHTTPNAIIGKALESSDDKGIKKILMLVK